MAYSLNQKKALAIIPHFTGLLSFIGSCSILYDIWNDRQRKLRRPYYRILLGMSCADALTSFWLGLSTWPIPRGSEGIYAAVGTRGSCTAQGFFVQLILVSPFYNLMLSFYYLLLGRWEFTEEEIARRFERYMHVFAIIPGLGMAIAGLPLTLYNCANLWCWIAAYPPNCENNSGEPGDVPCERGQGSWLYRWALFYGPVWVIILLVTILMVMLTRSVRVDEKRAIELQKRTRSQRPSFTRPDVLDLRRSVSSLPQNQANRYERSRQMFHQAAFYVGVFYVTWVFVTVNRLLQLIDGQSHFPLMVLHAIFGPSQGFFNFLVYRHGPCVA